MSKSNMMMHLRTLPLLRTLSIEAREVVRWAIGEIERLSLTDAERKALVRNLRHGNGMWLMHVSQKDKAVIDALLERHAPRR